MTLALGFWTWLTFLTIYISGLIPCVIFTALWEVCTPDSRVRKIWLALVWPVAIPVIGIFYALKGVWEVVRRRDINKDGQ